MVKRKEVRRSKKKHSRTSPEIQSKELNEILRTNENLTSRSIKQSQQKDNLKVKKLKYLNKLNKKTILYKIFEAFIMKAKYDTFQYTHLLTHKT